MIVNATLLAINIAVLLVALATAAGTLVSIRRSRRMREAREAAEVAASLRMAEREARKGRS